MYRPEDLLKIEEDAVDQATSGWRGDVEGFRKAVLLILATRMAGEDDSVTLAKIKALLASLPSPVGMDEAALKGVELAHEFALGVFRSVMKRTPPKIPVSKNSKDAVTGLDKAADEAISQSISNLNRIAKANQTSVLTAVAPVLQSPARSKAAVAWATNNASNSATAKMAKKLGERVCWVSERDACVHCLAYSGDFSDGGDFSPRTFAAKPLKTAGRIYHPPLHPHCRCAIEIGITDEYAAALKRESVRSILKGFKMPSESEKVRLEAAQRLLEQDPVAPASVKKYTERAVKRGKFN